MRFSGLDLALSFGGILSASIGVESLSCANNDPHHTRNNAQIYFYVCLISVYSIGSIYRTLVIPEISYFKCSNYA